MIVNFLITFALPKAISLSGIKQATKDENITTSYRDDQ